MTAVRRREGADEAGRALARVRRNFWLLALATTVALGVLGTALRQPPSPVVGVLTAVSALAALVTLSLAGRILLVVTRR